MKREFFSLFDRAEHTVNFTAFRRLSMKPEQVFVE
jgi:hypothetical protein